MSTILPVNIDDLLNCRGIESARTTGPQVLKTICAFANDLQNLNGGYIVLGVAESGGRAIMPPQGLSDGAIDEAQKWIRGNCNRIEPEYMPFLSPETVDGAAILVIWVPASDGRPHRGPGGDGEKSYWVR